MIKSIKVRLLLSSATAETETTNATAAACREPKSIARRKGVTSPVGGSNNCATKCVKMRNHATIQSCNRAEWLCRFNARKMPTSTATVTTVGIFSRRVINNKVTPTHSISIWPKNQAILSYQSNTGKHERIVNPCATFTIVVGLNILVSLLVTVLDISLGGRR